MGAGIPEGIERRARADGLSIRSAGPDETAGVPDTAPILRTMERRDVGAVAEIESTVFSNPWSAATFEQLLDRSDAELLVMEAPEGGIVAYAVLWCVLEQGELANLAVVDGWRRGGLGTRLLDAVIERARRRDVRSLFLEVRVSNERAARLYAAREFEEVGRRRNYYDRPREDARVLMKKLNPPISP